MAAAGTGVLGVYEEKNDGKQRIKFNRPYDDGYALLACHIVSVLSVKSIKTALTSDQFIKSMVIDESKQIDICGHFLDCIDEEIIKKEHIRQKNKFLKALGEYYFSELDLPRLREEIRKFAEELGINLDN